MTLPFTAKQRRNIGKRFRASAACKKPKLEDKDAKKAYDLKRRYGMSLELYQSMLDQQDNKCKICCQEKKLVVDHDHKTGKIRGLLCASCNILLGTSKDSTEILEGAIKYLNTGE